MRQKKTWREKLADTQDLPKVQSITGRMAKRWGTGALGIPAPIEVDAIAKRVPKGKLIATSAIRQVLATKHGADIACPITAGISAWIGPGAVAGDEADGKKGITPYWRTLKSGVELNPKYPGGIQGQEARLESEGHTVWPRRRSSLFRTTSVRS